MTISPSLTALFSKIAPQFNPAFIYQHLLTTFKINRDELDIRIAEFLKLMFLRSKYDGAFIPLSDDIDFLWEKFIVQTRDYELFCFSLPGKKFIHHNSGEFADFSQGKNKKEVIAHLLSWIPLYYFHFGEFTKESAMHWMIVKYLQDELKLSLFEINRIGKDNQSLSS